MNAAKSRTKRAMCTMPGPNRGSPAFCDAGERNQPLHGSRGREQVQAPVVLEHARIRVTLRIGVLRPQREPATEPVAHLQPQARDLVRTIESLVPILLVPGVQSGSKDRTPRMSPGYTVHIGQNEIAQTRGLVSCTRRVKVELGVGARRPGDYAFPARTRELRRIG